MGEAAGQEVMLPAVRDLRLPPPLRASATERIVQDIESFLTLLRASRFLLFHLCGSQFWIRSVSRLRHVRRWRERGHCGIGAVLRFLGGYSSRARLRVGCIPNCPQFVLRSWSHEPPLDCSRIVAHAGGTLNGCVCGRGSGSRSGRAGGAGLSLLPILAKLLTLPDHVQHLLHEINRLLSSRFGDLFVALLLNVLQVPRERHGQSLRSAQQRDREPLDG